MARLGDVIKIKPSTVSLKGERIWLLNLDMVEQQTGRVFEHNFVNVEDLDGSIVQFDEDAVLYSKLRPNLNKVVLPDMAGFATSEMLPLMPDTAVLTREYLAYFLRSDSFVTWAVSKTAGAKMPRLGSKELLSKEIPLPTLGEQFSIAQQFVYVDTLISLRKQQLAKLDELVKSRFIELFGDKRYPEDTLLNLCNIIDYRGKTPEKVESGLPFITAKNVRMHQMNLEPREYISKETYDKVMVRGFPREGDVVFTTEAPLGNVCRIPHFDTEFYIGQRIVTMQTEKLEPIYLEHALSSDDFKTKYMGKSSGSTVTGIRVRLLEQLTIPVPPRELQKQFAAFVEQTDKSKLSVQQSIDQLETLKKSLMQKYFG